MRTFAYERPGTVDEAVTLLDAHGPEARILAGGTDLIIRLRDGSLQPSLVSWTSSASPSCSEASTCATTWSSISAGTVMSDVAAHPDMRRHFPALVEAAEVVGSVQIRNRATLAGNVCNASPAADTAPPLLVYGAVLVIAGPAGQRRLALDDFFVSSGRTTLVRGELVTAIELPLPARRHGCDPRPTHPAARSRPASVTLCCAVDDSRVTRIAYGSVGSAAVPRRRRQRAAGRPGGIGR